MLSDRERETLQEIQRRLLVDDPDFVRSFEPTDRPAEQPSPRDRQRRAYTVWIVLALVSSALMLALGLPGTAVVLAAGAGLIGVERRYRDDLWRRGT